MVPRLLPALSARALAALGMAVGCALALPEPAGAEVVSARVIVRGMTCNICAATVERQLKRVSCVVKASVDLERGLAQINPRDGQRFDGRRILKAIRAAGFTPGDIHVVARGRLLLRDGSYYLDLGNGDVAVLAESRGGALALVVPAPGGNIEVSGRFNDPAEDARASVGITVENAIAVGSP